MPWQSQMACIQVRIFSSQRGSQPIFLRVFRYLMLVWKCGGSAGHSTVSQSAVVFLQTHLAHGRVLVFAMNHSVPLTQLAMLPLTQSSQPERHCDLAAGRRSSTRPRGQLSRPFCPGHSS